MIEQGPINFLQFAISFFAISFFAMCCDASFIYLLEVQIRKIVWAPFTFDLNPNQAISPPPKCCVDTRTPFQGPLQRFYFDVKRLSVYLVMRRMYFVHYLLDFFFNSFF
jgi:hypothetical protein